MQVDEGGPSWLKVDENILGATSISGAFSCTLWFVKAHAHWRTIAWFLAALAALYLPLSLIHSFNHSLIHSFIHSFIDSFIHYVQFIPNHTDLSRLCFAKHNAAHHSWVYNAAHYHAHKMTCTLPLNFLYCRAGNGIILTHTPNFHNFSLSSVTARAANIYL